MSLSSVGALKGSEVIDLIPDTINENRCSTRKPNVPIPLWCGDELRGRMKERKNYKLGPLSNHRPGESRVRSHTTIRHLSGYFQQSRRQHAR